MKEKINYIISDPEGNTTILVLTQVGRKDYQAVARQLLEECPQAEQVGFVKTDETGEPVSMEMCGLEFCGNATRAFGFYKSMRTDPPADELFLTVSGCDHPLKGWIQPPERSGADSEAAGSEDVWVRDADGYICGRVRIQMPVPTEIEEVRIPAGKEFADLVLRLTGGAVLEGRIVHMDGISHLVIPGASDKVIREEGQETIGKLFCYIRDYIYEANERDIPAFGVMFVDNAADWMNPIVYVRDVDTIYFEGSCASGSAASACAQAVIDLAEGKAGEAVQGRDGSAEMYAYRFRQPAGTLCIDVEARDGAIRGLQLYGGVRQSEVIRSEVNL